MRTAPPPYQNAEIAQPDEGNLSADLGCRTERKYPKVISTFPDRFRPFPTSQPPFFNADGTHVQCSRLPSYARGQELIFMSELLEQRELLFKLIDENALAQRVAKILAEILRGTDLASAAVTEPPKSIAAFCKSEGMSRAFFYALKRKGM